VTGEKRVDATGDLRLFDLYKLMMNVKKVAGGF
jgi:hypothetical protein